MVWISKVLGGVVLGGGDQTIWQKTEDEAGEWLFVHSFTPAVMRDVTCVVW